MFASASGLARDVSLIRRRAWLFIPFLVVGVVLAFLLGTARGDLTAAASLALETVVHGLPNGSDRGIRAFDAETMIRDEAFQREVRAAAEEPDLDYGRYRISASGGSAAENLSRVTLTVSITDSEASEAERLRDAFVEAFLSEYEEQDGLFRRRYISRVEQVAESAGQEFRARYEELRTLAEEREIEDFGRLGATQREDLIRDLNREAATLSRELAEVEGALSAAANAGPEAAAAIAASIIGQPVAPADAVAALEGKRAALIEARRLLDEQQLALGDPELVSALDQVQAWRTAQEEAFDRLANAQIAVRTADTNVTVSKSLSGGLGSSPVERVAVALAVTLVFGLIAIYLLEWLAQVRSGIQTSQAP